MQTNSLFINLIPQNSSTFKNNNPPSFQHHLFISGWIPSLAWCFFIDLGLTKPDKNKTGSQRLVSKAGVFTSPEYKG